MLSNSSISFDLPFEYATPIAQKDKSNHKPSTAQPHTGQHTSSAFKLLSTYTSPRHSSRGRAVSDMRSNESRIDYSDEMAYGETMRHGHPDITQGQATYDPSTHTFVTKSALNTRSPTATKRSGRSTKRIAYSGEVKRVKERLRQVISLTQLYSQHNENENENEKRSRKAVLLPPLN